MSLRVLLIVALALAGCAAKSTDPGQDAQVMSSSQAPLGSGGRGSGSQDPANPTGTPGNGAAPGAGASPGVPNAASTSTLAAPPNPSATSAPATTTSPSTSTTPATTTKGTASTTTTASSTTASSSSSPPAAPPAQVTQACSVALTGLHGLVPPLAYVASCSPTAFVSSTGAAFTHATVQVVSSAALLPSAALVQVKDASGNVLGSATGLGSFTVPVPTVPATPSVPLSALVTLTGVFTDYQATVTITLS